MLKRGTVRVGEIQFVQHIDISPQVAAAALAEFCQFVNDETEKCETNVDVFVLEKVLLVKPMRYVQDSEKNAL
ncbi:hypothetical protein STEG23_003735 [Scotinomys teguina]